MRSVSNLFSLKHSLFSALGFAALTMLAAMPVSAAPPEERVQCILGQPGAPNGLQCTANDTTLSSPTVAIIEPCDFPGDTAKLNVTVDITVGAKTRYDLAVWLSVDGDPNQDGSETGICSVLTLPNDVIHVDQVTSTFGDGDQCGDVFNVAPDGIIVPPTETAHILNVDLGTVDLLCLDDDGDGKIDVPVIVAWEQQAGNNCAVSSEALPGTGSKCVQDNSLALDIPIPARLIVNKDAIPDDAQGFGFLLTGLDSGISGGFDGSHPFTLFDNGITPALATFDSGTEFTGGLLAGDYVLGESAPNGWFQLSAVCSSDRDGLNTDPAALTLRPGETVTCDFVNVPSTADLTIRKVTVGGTGSFDFTTSGSLGDTMMTLDTSVTNPVDWDQTLEFGTYDVWEDPVAGYVLTSATCDGGQGIPDLAGGALNGIVLSPGDSVICTFTNAALGSVSVNKVALGGDAMFSYTTTVPGGAPFTITTTDGTGTSTGITSVPVGTYQVAETLTAPDFPDGWEFVSATCVDQDLLVVDTATVVPGGVEFTQADGQTTSCTFTNKKLGSFLIKKVTNPAGNVTDSFTFDNDASLLPATFSLMDNQFNLQEDVPVSDDPTATTPYAITEQDPTPGFDLIDVTCESSLGEIENKSSGDVGTRTANIAIRAGEEVVCTFTNTQRASINVAKQISANPNGLPTLFAFTTDFDAPFNLDPDNGPADMDFTGLVPAQAYMVAETNPNAQGWALISATCGTQAEAVNLSTGVISNIIPGPGDDISCVFINAPLGSATIVKNAVGGDDIFGFTGSLEPFNNNGAGFEIDTSISDTADFTNLLLPNEIYDVQEDVIPANWTLTDVTCVDATNDSVPDGTEVPPADPALGAFIRAAVNETVTCTFTNEADATLIIEKVTIPATDTTTQFAFTGTGALTGNLVGGDSASETAAQGTFLADETPTAGWALTNIQCSGVAADKITIGGTAGFVAGNTDVSVDLAPGETATCIYTNTRLGSITIEKATVGDVGGFTFTGSDVDNDAGIITSPFVLSTDTNDANPSSILFSGLLPGQYLFSETVPVGWEIDGTNGDIVCTGPDGFTSQWTPGSNSLDMNFLNGEDLVCTFTNTRQATIIVEKTTDPTTTTQGFSFAGDVAGGPITNGGTIKVENLSPGTYTSTETPVAGWDLTDITCDDGDSTGDTGTGIATFNAAAGEIITCTFTNTIQRGTIIVDKVTDPTGSTQLFDFSTNYSSGNFQLADGTTPNNSGPILPSSEAQPYSVAEQAVAGWDQTSVVCTGDIGGDKDPALIDLLPGETVNCVFTNTIQAAQIIVDKQTAPVGSPVLFDFTLTGTNVDQAFQLADATTAYNSGDLLPMSENGPYNVAETLPADWSAVSATCSDGSDPTAVDLNPGEVVTCTFVNAQAGQSTFTKLTLGGDDTFNFTTTLPGGNFSLTTTGGTSPTSSTGMLPAGSYTITEDVLAGWELTDMVCIESDTQDSVIDIPNRTITLNVQDGETINCTITNTKLGSITVSKVTVPTGDPTMFTFTGDVAGSIVDGGTIVVSDLSPGTYTSVEGVLVDWDLTNITCDDGVSTTPSTGDIATLTATFNLDAGEDVICTFTNTLQESINLAKTVNGSATLEADGTYTVVYTITATNTGGPGVYDLNDAFTPGVGITLDSATAEYVAGTEDSQTGALGAYPTFVTGESLAAGMDESWTVTAIFTIDLALVTAEGNDCDDTNAGGENTGFTNGVTGSSTDTDLTDNVACTEFIPPAISLDKTSDVPTYKALGDVINYDYLITNLGPDVLDPGLASVVDDKETVTCPAAAPLLVGGTVTCTASHVVTQADLDAGFLTNVATAMVDDVTSNEDTVTVTATILPPVDYEPLAVPVNDKLALLLLTLMLLATGWYFIPAAYRKF